ncbi:copper-binding protein [uncultured Jannaschia sp.]|uniref:copper-binding protein n=1 Tax=uncultured Jannaschia sp. TaxID=293347 RepID=UPI00262E8A61|nr:copper-binding protein [uncultured Jannaschia sp.]
MKTFAVSAAMAATLTLAAVPTALFAQDVAYTKGSVKAIDADAGKVTLIHEELENLGMPAMTMVFRADEETLARMAEGDDIEFVADRVEGKLTVVELKE